MSYNEKNIDLIIQYALLTAGQGDDYLSRRLGPIHLIKYVYLADLYYAQKHNGTSFTGINWQFFHFGPWSFQVNNRIDAATSAILANRHSFDSHFKDEDVVRWEISDDDLLKRMSREVPSEITIKLKNNIRKYSSDTEGLLGFVYQTEPMLNTAPNDYIDFSIYTDQDKVPIEKVMLRFEQISNKKKKAFSQKIKALKLARTFGKKKLIPVTTPRHDEIYNDGINWLDTLAGEEFPTGRLKAQFSTDVWGSDTRKGKQ